MTGEIGPPTTIPKVMKTIHPLTILYIKFNIYVMPLFTEFLDVLWEAGGK